MDTVPCPRCHTSGHPGYLTYPPSEKSPYGTVIRCEVCEGHGIATDWQVFTWEMSL